MKKLSWVQTEEWRSYCVYSGKHFPRNELSEEHVVPKSLGGTRATVIFASSSLNSGEASKIDARLCGDTMISNARFHAQAKGHSKKAPKDTIKGATKWPKGQPLPEPDPRYNLTLRHGTYPIVYNTKTGKHEDGVDFQTDGFIVYDMSIDNENRVKFGIKSFLGLGWKLFGPELLEACDCDRLRTIWHRSTLGDSSAWLSPVPCWTPFTIAPESSQQQLLKAIGLIVKRKEKTTILMRKLADHLEWTVCCLGEIVSTIYIPLRRPLLKGEVQEEGGILLTVAKDYLVPQLVAPLQIKTEDGSISMPVKTYFK